MTTGWRHRARVCALAAAGAALPLLMSACNKDKGIVGDGNGPDHIEVSATTAAAGAAFFEMFECFRAQVNAVLVFKDGSRGNFTSRVIWSSDSPGTVTVSNGDQPTPSGGFYPNGTVTPVGGGSATITANYFGLTASIGVNVSGTENLRLQRVIQSHATEISPAGFRMGVGTVEDLTVVATLDSREQNVEATGVIWSFDTPDDGEATIDPASGVITGVGAGGALIATARFDSCDKFASTTVTVAEIQAITTVTEFPDNPMLVVGNTELVNVFADFGDGPEQDISTQATITSSDTNVLSFTSGSVFAAGIPNIANALLAGGPVVVSATFNKGGTDLTAPDLRISTFSAELQGFTVDPQEALATIGSSVPVQFKATGSYLDGSFAQDITRQVNWTSSDTTLATIDNATTKPQTAGQALAVGGRKGTVTVTATDSNSIGQTFIEVLLNVDF